MRLPSGHELRRELERDPQARARLHEALKEFPAPDDVSAVVNQLVNHEAPDEGMGVEPEYSFRPTELAAGVICVCLPIIVILLAVIAAK